MSKNNSNSLTKLVITTVFFCLVLTIFLSTTFLVMFPRTASDTFNKLGADELSARYAKASYDRSGEFDDLVNTFSRGVQAEDNKIVKQYGEIFLADENFDSYVEFQNNLQPQYDYRLWVEGNYLIALNEIKGVKEAIASLEINYDSEYGDVAPIKYIANSLKIKELDVDELKIQFKIIDRAYEVVYNNLLGSGKDVTPLIVDAYSMAEAFGQTSLAEKWSVRYDGTKS